MKIVIFGTTAFSVMIGNMVERYTDNAVIAYTVDGAYKKEDEINGKPVIAFEDMEQMYPKSEVKILITVGYKKMCSIRKNTFEKVKEKGYELAEFVHPSAYIAPTSERGEGNIILENAILGENAKIGEGNIIWNGSNVSHDVKMGNYNYLAPSVVLGGKVMIEDNCFLGLGAIALSHIAIASYTLIGAGCYVSKNTEPQGVYVPVRSIKLENKTCFDMNI